MFFSQLGIFFSQMRILRLQARELPPHLIGGIVGRGRQRHGLGYLLRGSWHGVNARPAGISDSPLRNGVTETTSVCALAAYAMLTY